MRMVRGTLVVLLAGAALTTAAFLNRETTPVPPPGQHREGEKTAAVPAARPAIRFAAPPGSILDYELHGGMDVRHVMDFGNQKVPIRVRFSDVESAFALRVRERLPGGWLVSVSPRRFSGTVTVEGPQGSSTQSVNIADLASRDPSKGDLLLVQFDDLGGLRDLWVPIGADATSSRSLAESLESMASLIALFPPLPGDNAQYEAEIDFFGQISVVERLDVTSTGPAGCEIVGEGVRISRLLGAPLGRETDVPASAARALARSTFTFDVAAGYYSRVHHRVGGDASGGNLSIETRMELVGRRVESPVPLGQDHLKSMKRLTSVAALRRLIESQPSASSSTKPADVDEYPAAILREMEELLSNPKSPSPDTAALEDRLEKLLIARPGKIGDLEALVAARHPGDAVLLLVTRVLSAASTRTLPGAEQAALGFVRRMKDESTLMNAFAAVQGHSSAGAVDFLFAYQAASPQVDHMRYVNLGVALKRALNAGEEGLSARILESTAEALRQSKAPATSALHVFQSPGESVDRFIERRWKDGVDPASTMAMMVVRSSGNSSNPGFKAIIDTQLFAVCSDEILERDILPIAGRIGNRDLLEKIRDRSTSESVRRAVDLQLRSIPKAP